MCLGVKSMMATKMMLLMMTVKLTRTKGREYAKLAKMDKVMT